MRNLIIKLFLFSFIFSQTNSIDIATTGANKLRMHGQLNVFHNPATMGYYAKQSHIDTLNSNVSLEDLSEQSEESQVQSIDNNENEFSEFENSQDDLGDSLSLKIDEVIASSDSIIADTLDVKSHLV